MRNKCYILLLAIYFKTDERMVENYFDHDADIGIIGWGVTLEESFAEGAKAMFALMTDLSKVNLTKSVLFEFKESDVELAFVTWLNTLIAYAQADNLILASFQIKRMGDVWQCHAKGEAWRDEMIRGIDVKGATLSMLEVKQMDSKWKSQCIVDV